jgi:hypothetical protein
MFLDFFEIGVGVDEWMYGLKFCQNQKFNRDIKGGLIISLV